MYSPFLACLSHTIYAKPFVWAAHLINNNILKVWLSPKEKKCYTGYRKNRWPEALINMLVKALVKVLVKARAEMQVKALAKVQAKAFAKVQAKVQVKAQVNALVKELSKVLIKALSSGGKRLLGSRKRRGSRM
jgi:hypothetical protein